MDLNQVVDCLVATAAKALTADAAAVLLLEETGKHLTLVGECGLPEALRKGHAIPLHESPPDRAALSGGVAVWGEGDANGRTSALPAVFRAALGVRLGRPGRLLGTLHVYSAHPRRFETPEIELLQALAELGTAAIEAARRLADQEQIEASKSEFVRVTTHELRSPITVAQSLVRTALKGYADPLTDKQQDVLGRIARQLDFLESLVNDLLDLAASKTPVLAAAGGPVAVNASIGRVVLLLQPRAEEKGVSMALHPCCEELAVWATEDGLDRIFVNLVGNAVKYTPTGGRVTVSMCQAGGEIQVAVTDTGIGIPPEALPHLFEEFYRAPNARALNAVGTGLGLAIVKELVDRYKGRITVESTPGKGSTFTVVLPAYRLAGQEDLT